jgi:Leucine-rich repeat (LRR) protein
MQTKTGILLLVLLVSACEPSRSETKISCREKRFKAKDSCDLRKIKIVSDTENFKIDPKSQKTFKVLHIEKEIVHFLPENLMKFFKELSILIVVESELSKIDKKTFKHSQNLEEINLEKNRIVELKIDTFNGLEKLKDLNLANNQIKRINSKTFKDNTALENLRLDNNEIEKVHEKCFKNLKQLEFLSMENNKIVELSADTFKENSNLLTINLSNNKLKYISEFVFTIPNGKLRKVSLVGNECLHDDDNFLNPDNFELQLMQEKFAEHCLPIPVKECRDDLESAKKEIEKIQEMFILRIEEIENEHKNIFNKLETKLESKISILEKDLTEAKEKLDFEKKKTFEAEKQFQKYRNFTEVYKNNHEGLTKDKDEAMTKLIECEIEKNLSERKNPQNNEEHLEMERKFDELKNKVEEKSFFEFICEVVRNDSCVVEGLVVPLDNMKIRNVDSLDTVSTKILTISSSFMTFLPQNIFTIFKSLTNVDISHSNVRYINESFNDAFNMQQLNLTNNLISSLSNSSFKMMKSLRVLNLESNRIKNLEPEAFSGLSELETLSLRKNMIEEIPENVFQELFKLKILNLANNQIKHLYGNLFENNIQLEIILINKNPIQFISSNLLDRCLHLKVIYFGNTNCIKESAHTSYQMEFKTVVSRQCSA